MTASSLPYAPVTKVWSDETEGTATDRRPRRFRTAIRIVWRPEGATEWRDGMSINLSRTGVLFHSDRLEAAGTRIDLLLAMGYENSEGVDMADVLCSGRIVRTIPIAPPETQHALAATIESFQFIRPHHH